MEHHLPNLYSHFSVIQEELARRRKDEVLLRKVRDLFGESAPFAIGTRPFAILSRSIATPNRELEYFLDLLQGTDFEPLILEYNGKLVAKNMEKYFLSKPHFYNETNRQLKSKKLIDFNKWEGKMIHDILTEDGKNLKTFHRELLNRSEMAKSLKIVDITDWFNSVRKDERGYYFYFLSLCIVHGVLFENYLAKNDDERSFFLTKVWPSFEAVSHHFGVKPLVFPLLPLTEENREDWHHHRGGFGMV